MTAERTPNPDREQLLSKLRALAEEHRGLDLPAADEALVERLGDVALGPEREALLDLLAETSTVGEAQDAERRSVGRPTAGLRVGPYLLESEIGQGGQGVVWLARDTRLDRSVAVKLLPAVRGHALERLRREAMLASRVEDPGVCPIYDFGEADGTPYLAMRYIQGTSLSQLIADARTRGDDRLEVQPAGDSEPDRTRSSSVTRCATDAVLPTIERLARSLHVAHEAGLVHRDIKPGNLIVGDDGQPVILDFGLARDESVDSSLTAPGDVVGTPAYMSPEQINGKLPRLDRRTDVWSLGATLYECLTLERPYDGPTREQVYRSILSREPVPVHHRRPDLSRDLSVVVSTALEKDLDRRYASAFDFAEDLRRVRMGEPVAARPLGPIARTSRWMARNRAVASLGIGLVCVLSVALVTSLYLLSETRQAVDEKNQALWTAYRNQARAAVASPEAGHRFGALDAVAKAARLRPAAELRDIVIAALSTADMRLLTSREAYPRGSVDVSYDAEGKRYVRSSEEGRLTLHDAETHALLREIRDDVGKTEFLELDPTGRHVAVRTKTLLRVFEVDTSREAARVERTRTWCADFSHDGEVLATIDIAGRVRVWEGFPLELTRESQSLTTPTNIRLDPSATRALVTSATRDRVQVLDLLDAGPSPIWTIPKARSASWDPDGTKIYVPFAGGVRVLDASDAHAPPREIATGHRRSVVNAEVSPDGSLLVTNSFDLTLRLWALDSGEQLAETTVGYGRISFLAGTNRFTTHREPNGQVLWELSSKPLHRAIPGSATAWPTFSPDGRWIVAHGRSGARVYCSVSGRVLGEIPGSFHPWFSQFDFTPEGSALVGLTGEGVEVWPIEADDKVVRLGPPRPLARLLEKSDLHLAAQSRRVVFKKDRSKVAVLDLDDPEFHRTFHKPGLYYVAINPDGKIAAAGAYSGTGIRIWDVDSKETLADLPAGNRAMIEFSDDGRFLVAYGADTEPFEFRIWSTSDWSLLRTIPGIRSSGHALFLPGSEELVYGRSVAELEIAARDDVSVLARWKMRDGQDLSYLGVCRTTGRIARGGSPLHIWDLPAMRRELRRLGLDWSDEPLPAELEPETRRWQVLSGGAGALEALDEVLASDPHEVRTLLARAVARERAGQLDAALADVRSAHSSAPRDPSVLALLGRLLSRSGCYSESRDRYRELLGLPLSEKDESLARLGLGWSLTMDDQEPYPRQDALRHLRRSLHSRPKQPITWTAYALALTRAGLFDEAREAYRQSIALAKGQPDAYHLHGLAWIAANRGDAERARELLEESDRLDRAKPASRSFQRLRERVERSLDGERIQPREEWTEFVDFGLAGDDKLEEPRQLRGRLSGHWDALEPFTVRGASKIMVRRVYSGDVAVLPFLASEGHVNTSAAHAHRWRPGWAWLRFWNEGDSTYRITTLPLDGSVSIHLIGASGQSRRQTFVTEWTMGWNRGAIIPYAGNVLYAHLKTEMGDLHVSRLNQGRVRNINLTRHHVRPGWSALEAVRVDSVWRLMLQRAHDGATRSASFTIEGQIGAWEDGPHIPGRGFRIAQADSGLTLAVTLDEGGVVRVLRLDRPGDTIRETVIEGASVATPHVVGETVRILVARQRSAPAGLRRAADALRGVLSPR